MAKKVIVLHPDSNLLFSFYDREVKVSESMSVEDAEVIAKQYPGLYVEVIDAPEVVIEAKASEALEVIAEALNEVAQATGTEPVTTGKQPKGKQAKTD